MKKLIALYKMPADEAAFMAHYEQVHTPLAKALPGLVKLEVTRIARTLVGEEGNFFMAELYFTDEAFRDAMRSPENAALGQDLGLFADGLVTIMTGDVAEA